MRVAFVLLALVATAGAIATSNAAAQGDQSNAAIQKVIAMLLDMAAKAKQAKNDEEVTFAQFQTWCTMESANLQKSIAKDGETIELLSAEITKLGSEAKGLGENVAELQATVASAEGDKKAQEAQRAKDYEAYVAELQDYSESISALDRAIVVLQKQSADRPGSAAVLLQLANGEGVGAQLPAKARAMVAAFMDMMGGRELAADGADNQAPEANAYEFQSGGIVDMLKKLQSEFVAKKGQCEKEEMNSKHAFDMVVADLVDTIENSNKDAEEKTALKESKLQRQAQAKGELASTQDSKAESEKTLSSMNTECSEKGMSYEEKQKLRSEEIEALAQATEILSSDDVGGGAKYLDLLAGAKATALIQLRDSSSEHGVHAVQRQVRDFIHSEGARLHSRGLTLLAESMAANPFAKVKKLIDDMITRLLEEANADAEHEGFCDKEMGESKITRNKLNEDIDQLTASVEDGKATIMTLTQEIANLEKEVSDLRAAMAEATDLRTDEKAKNKATVEDAKAAAGAVSRATAVLKDFYAKAGQATGFLQTGAVTKPAGAVLLGKGIKMGTDEWNSLANPNWTGGTVDKGHKAGMQTFGKQFTGQQDSAGGVLAMLEVIASDFANLEADTEAAETASQSTFDDFMTESKKNVRVKSKKIELDTSDKTDAESKMREDVADLKNTQDELLAAERYYDKLVPQCIDKGQTFEERTAAREEEIASLKQALEILSSADIGTSA